jgi:hypothetical protein
MVDLESTLRELAAETRYPPTPDLAPRVVARIAGRRRRRLGVLALAAALLCAVGIALAVPPARSAILDWLGFGPIQIRHTERLPRVPGTVRRSLGTPTTVAGATRLAHFQVLVLPRKPDGVYVRDGEVTLVYGALLLGELRGTDVLVAQKVVGPGTRVEQVEIEGEPGLWLAGAPHVFAYLDRNGAFIRGRIRLVGDTLLWQSNGLVLRLEGATTKAEALRLAASVRQAPR